MSTNTTETAYAAYASIEPGKPTESAVIRQRRHDAIEQAVALPFPLLEKMRIDRWNWKNRGTYRPGKRCTHREQLPAHVLERLDPHTSNVIVQHNSAVIYTELDKAHQEQGVILCDLAQAIDQHGETVRQRLFGAIPVGEDQLTAWHAAVWNGGVYLYVPSKVTLPEPIQIILFLDDAEATFAPHILVVAEQDSRVQLVMHVMSTHASAQTPQPTLVTSTMMEVFAQPRSHVHIALVHEMGEHITEVCYRRAVIGQDATVQWVIGELSDGWSIADTQSLLLGPRAQSEMHVIGLGSQEQRIHQTTRAVHRGKASESNMVTRVVMRQSATAIINGITKIEHGATRANGQQTERILMLSPTARGDANPILLIDEDDVKAGHAASVGQVNPEQIYYLMSRGIPRKEAERLLIQGFLAPTIAAIPMERVRTQLTSRVERKLFS